MMHRFSQPNGKHVIFETVFGSTLFGTNTPNSDLDMKRVYIPHPRQIILPEGTGTLGIHTKQDPNAKNTKDDTDIEELTLRRFVEHVLEGQPQALDMLFATPHVIGTPQFGSYSSIWYALWVSREKLFSRRPAGFLQYCHTQANKYGIKGSRLASARAALATAQAWQNSPSLAGIPTSEIEWLCKQHPDFIRVIPSGNAEFTPSKTFLEVNTRKFQYTLKMPYVVASLQKMVDGYGNRAKLAEQNEGVDWKALSHAVRIGEQALEFLSTGFIRFPRHNAWFLKQIKQGLLPYKEVADRIEMLLDQVERAAKVSALPEEPDEAWASEFVYNTYTEHVRRYG